MRWIVKTNSVALIAVDLEVALFLGLFLILSEELLQDQRKSNHGANPQEQQNSTLPDNQDGQKPRSSDQIGPSVHSHNIAEKKATVEPHRCSFFKREGIFEDVSYRECLAEYPQRPVKDGNGGYGADLRVCWLR